MDLRNCKYTFLPLLLLLGSSPLLAQRGDPQLKGLRNLWELNVTVGANNFEGDLGGTPGIGGTFKDYTLHTERPLIGVSATYNFNFTWSVRAGFNYTSVEGFDSLIKNTGDQERWRIYRNGNFKSNIWEAYVSCDVFPLMLFQKTYEIQRLSPVF